MPPVLPPNSTAQAQQKRSNEESLGHRDSLLEPSTSSATNLSETLLDGQPRALFSTSKIILDGKEAFNSGKRTNANELSYEVNVDGVNELKLIVDDAGNGKNSDWGQWLSPQLSR